MEMQEDIVIVGAGIAGLATALGLHRLGLRSLVLEISDSLRFSGFAFTTWSNAWKALDALGVGDLVRQHSYQLESMVVLSASSGASSSEISFIPSKGTRDRELRCLERKFLLETLANELPSDTIRFSSKVVSIEESGRPYFKLLHLADGSTVKTQVLIGCDGVNSVVGRWLGLKKPSSIGRSAIRGFVDFKQSHGFEPKFMQFMGDGARYGIVPINESSLYWFLTFSSSSCPDKEIEESSTKMKQYVLSNLGKASDRVKGVIENTKLEDIVCSPLRIRPPWEVLWGNIVKGNVCVTGDAFHPMTPDLGQGACSALEDGIALARSLGQALLERQGRSDQLEKYNRIKTGLEKYAKERKWRAFDLIATGYVVGLIEESNWMFLKFLRDGILSTYLAGLRSKKSEFDCGQLN